MGKILVCGSIAYDNIMDFPGRFKEHILPDKIHNLNVSFLVNSLKRLRGGTAPNIAYNLALTGQNPAIVGTAGRDFSDYRDWLNENSIDTEYIRLLEDDFTASCFITSDISGNQITGFYPGAMARDCEISLKHLDLDDVQMAIVAPTEPDAMIKWATECRELDIPYLFDPGMQIPRLSGQELIEGMMGASIVVFNEYEYDMMMEKTMLSTDDLLCNVELVVITLGEKGSILQNRREKVQVPAAKPIEVVDPTGAGDAYRAGLLKGYFEKTSLQTMGKYASVTAVYAVEHKGATEHRYTMDEFDMRYNENFGGI